MGPSPGMSITPGAGLSEVVSVGVVVGPGAGPRTGVVVVVAAVVGVDAVVVVVVVGVVDGAALEEGAGSAGNGPMGINGSS